ncbi:MAG: kynureninase [Alphaproteobacteria bacterium]
MPPAASRAECEARDAADPLAPFRDRFLLPEGVIYLDGNSLGPLARDVRARLIEVIDREWGTDLIQSWWKNDWVGLPRSLGDKIGRLVGAAPGQVVVADSTSVNIFKALTAALAMRPDRRTILHETATFPTDGYMAQGVARLLGQDRVRLREAPRDALAGAIDDDVAVVMLTHAHYKTGHIADMAGITAAAHAAGALTLWDLAHSAGALPVALDASHADFAVGCGYKFLNGGPGGPAFVYVAERLQGEAQQPLAGWIGHRNPFEFAAAYEPAPGIDRYQCGTPVVLAMAALDTAVDMLLEAGMDRVRAKSMALTATFIARVEASGAGLGLRLDVPRDATVRGSQVCFLHPKAGAIMQRVIAAGVIGDFRPPETMRFGFAPLFNRHVDAWDAAERLAALAREEIG